MRIPRTHHSTPPFDEQRETEKDDDGRRAYPLPPELDVKKPRFNFVPLGRQRPPREEENCRGEDPLRKLE
jgi:hypothetical protein